MTNLAFDALTRRASLAPLGAVGLTALAGFASSRPGAAKKKSANKKARKKCKQQVGPCTAIVTAGCEGDPDCLADFVPCCLFLENCDVSAFIACGL